MPDEVIKKEGSLNVPASELPQQEPPHDFRDSIHWAVFRIMSEFVDGFQFLGDFRKMITFFGSARFREGNRWYDEAQKLAALCAAEGFGILTGGGPGIMEAGNRGACDGGGQSVGLNIQLPYEQRINPYVKKGKGFYYFFSRKVMLSYSARVYVYFPGGFGTMDEFYEIITLIQTKKIPPIPVIVYGKEFWEPIVEWMKEKLVDEFQTISPEDVNIAHLVDSPQEAMEIIKKAPPRKELFTH